MKRARLVTPIAIAPLLALAGSRYHPVRSPESYYVTRVEGAPAQSTLVQESSRSPPQFRPQPRKCLSRAGLVFSMTWAAGLGRHQALGMKFFSDNNADNGVWE
jgi:hypothetical protein